MAFVKKDGFDFYIDVEKFVKSDSDKDKAKYYLTGKGAGTSKIIDVDLRTNEVVLQDQKSIPAGMTAKFLLSDYCMIITYQN